MQRHATHFLTGLTTPKARKNTSSTAPSRVRPLNVPDLGYLTVHAAVPRKGDLTPESESFNTGRITSRKEGWKSSSATPVFTKDNTSFDY